MKNSTGKNEQAVQDNAVKKVIVTMRGPRDLYKLSAFDRLEIGDQQIAEVFCIDGEFYVYVGEK